MKKIIALLLALVLAVSCFVACDNTKPEDTKAPVDTKPVDTKPVETDPVETEPENLFDGKHDIVEVTWMVRNNPQEDLEEVLDYLNKTYLEPRYNLHLNAIITSTAEYNDKMTLMMTGDEEWDICYSASWTNVYADRVAMGAFYDLNELMDTQEWKDLDAVMPEGLYDWAIIDGHLYGLPNLQIMSSPAAIYLQKELVDKYNINLKNDDYIENIVDNAELMKFLEAVRDNEEDYIPACFTATQFNSAINYDVNSKWNSYADYFGASVDRDANDYKVTYLPDDPEYKEYNIKQMAGKLEFSKLGFYRDDFLTNTDDSADVNANRYAIWATTGKPGGGPDMTNRMGKEYIQIYTQGMQYYQGTPMSTITCVNYNSKNPLAALKMIQVMWTDLDVYNTFLAGIPDEHYKKISDNRIEPIADSGYNLTGWGWGCGNQFNQWLIPGQEDNVWELTQAMNENGKVSCMNGFVLNQEPIQAEISNMKTVEAEYKNWFWFCKDEAEIRAKYDEYLAAREAAGQRAIIEEVQKQITEWATANGKI